MINVSEILTDADFAQSYTVQRTSGHWEYGRFIIDSTTNLNFYGPVLPSSAKELNQVPEGERITGMMTFYTTPDNPFQISYHTSDSDEGLSDLVVWRGAQYKLIQVFPYDDYGYQKAIGTKISGT